MKERINMKSGIYFYINKRNNKIEYIGQSEYVDIRSKRNPLYQPKKYKIRIMYLTHKSYTYNDNVLLLISLNNCTVTYNDTTLFEPGWGIFDMACGEEISSAFGGAADKGEFHKFIDKHIKKDIPVTNSSSNGIEKLNSYYKQVRDMRENNSADSIELEKIYHSVKEDFPDEWLLLYEILEIINGNSHSGWAQEILEVLEEKAKVRSDLGLVITRSLNLL